MTERLPIPEEVALIHQGVWRSINQRPGEPFEREEKTILYADSSLIIPDTIHILRERIKISSSEFIINNNIIPHPTFRKDLPVEDDFLQSGESVLQWVQYTYGQIIDEISAVNKTQFINPYTATSIRQLDTNLQNISDKQRIPANKTSEFLHPGAEAGFYVFRSLFLAIPQIENQTNGQVIENLRRSTVPLDLATGLEAQELIPIFKGMLRGHYGNGLNPDLLEKSSSGIIQLKYKPKELTAMFGSGQAHTEGQGICPAAVSRRHTLGNNFDALQAYFQYANQVLDAQNLACDVLEGLII